MKKYDVKIAFAIVYVIFISFLLSYFGGIVWIANDSPSGMNATIATIIGLFIVSRIVVIKICTPGQGNHTNELKFVGAIWLFSYIFMMLFYITILYLPENNFNIKIINDVDILLKSDPVRPFIMIMFVCIWGLILFAKIFFRLRREAIHKDLYTCSNVVFYFFFITTCLLDDRILHWFDRERFHVWKLVMTH